jgi:hypothetical protein
MLLVGMVKYFGFLSFKPIKSIRIKDRLNISIMDPLGIIFFDKHKKKISKGLLKIRSNFDPSKVHNYHLVKVSQKTISQLTI